MKYIVPVILAVNTALTVLAFLLIDVAQDAAVESTTQELWTLFSYVFIGGAIINGILCLISLFGIVKLRDEAETDE